MFYKLNLNPYEVSTISLRSRDIQDIPLLEVIYNKPFTFPIQINVFTTLNTILHIGYLHELINTFLCDFRCLGLSAIPFSRVLCLSRLSCEIWEGWNVKFGASTKSFLESSFILFYNYRQVSTRVPIKQEKTWKYEYTLQSINFKFLFLNVRKKILLKIF